MDVLKHHYILAILSDITLQMVVGWVGWGKGNEKGPPDDCSLWFHKTRVKTKQENSLYFLSRVNIYIYMGVVDRATRDLCT